MSLACFRTGKKARRNSKTKQEKAGSNGIYFKYSEEVINTSIFNLAEIFYTSLRDFGEDDIAHNIETVERLQKKVRDARANYKQSLIVLENVKKLNPKIYTKSSIMLGLGETDGEVIQAMKDLRKINADILTLGQYLMPTGLHIAINSFVAPEKFEYFKQKALELGFLYCALGHFVRSSYRAGELFVRNLLNR